MRAADGVAPWAGDFDDVLVVVGGTIRAGDDERLQEIGLAVFLPGTSMQDIIAFITAHVRRDALLDT